METHPDATPAHRPALWHALASTVPGFDARFIAVHQDGEFVGGAPVVIERRAGFHWIHALPQLLPGTPLARPGAEVAVDRAVGEALADLQRSLRAVGGAWTAYRPAGGAIAESSLAVPGGETRRLASALVDLAPGSIAPLERMDRKTRRDLRQARTAGLMFAEEPAALNEAYALHLGQARAWAGHRPLPLELSRRLLATGADPVGRLFTVRDPRGLLAAALALDSPRETLVWWSGTHPDGRSRHAFLLLMWSIVEWASEQGRARVNLGASGGHGPVASFKDSLGARSFEYPVRWLDARAAPATGKIVASLQSWARRGRHRGEAM